MAIPSAAGYPEYHGTLLPEVWVGRMLTGLYETSFLMDITTSDAEIGLGLTQKKKGDVMKIRKRI